MVVPIHMPTEALLAIPPATLRATCPRCQRPQRACLCPWVTPVANTWLNIQALARIMHPDEQRIPSVVLDCAVQSATVQPVPALMPLVELDRAEQFEMVQLKLATMPLWVLESAAQFERVQPLLARMLR